MQKKSRYLKVVKVPDGTPEGELRDYFQRFGRIQKLEIVTDRSESRSKSALVAFCDIVAACRCAAADLSIRGKELRVEFSDCDVFGLPDTKLIRTKNERESFVRNEFRGFIIGPSSGTFQRESTSPKGRGGRGNSAVRSRSFSPEAKRPRSPPSPVGRQPTTPTRDRSPAGGSRRARDHRTNTLEDRFYGLSMQGLPSSLSDSNIRDELFYEFKRYGPIYSVVIEGELSARRAIVTFKHATQARDAYCETHRKRFFGSEVRIKPHEGIFLHLPSSRLGRDDPDNPSTYSGPLGDELDEFHPLSSRTLFVGNLDCECNAKSIKDMFRKFGNIIELEIKRPNLDDPSHVYSFIQFTNIRDVVTAMRKMDGYKMNRKTIRTGFGKSLPQAVIWVGGLDRDITEQTLFDFISRHKLDVADCIIDRHESMALVKLSTATEAGKALRILRGRVIGSGRLMVDYASPELQAMFIDRMRHTGQLDRILQQSSGSSGGSRSASSRHSRHDNRRRSLSPAGSDQRNTGRSSNRRDRDAHPRRRRNSSRSPVRPMTPPSGGESGSEVQSVSKKRVRTPSLSPPDSDGAASTKRRRSQNRVVAASGRRHLHSPSSVSSKSDRSSLSSRSSERAAHDSQAERHEARGAGTPAADGDDALKNLQTERERILEMLKEIEDKDSSPPSGGPAPVKERSDSPIFEPTLREREQRRGDRQLKAQLGKQPTLGDMFDYSWAYGHNQRGAGRPPTTSAGDMERQFLAERRHQKGPTGGAAERRSSSPEVGRCRRSMESTSQTSSHFLVDEAHRFGGKLPRNDEPGGVGLCANDSGASPPTTGAAPPPGGCSLLDRRTLDRRTLSCSSAQAPPSCSTDSALCSPSTDGQTPSLHVNSGHDSMSSSVPASSSESPSTDQRPTNCQSTSYQSTDHQLEDHQSKDYQSRDQSRDDQSVDAKLPSAVDRSTGPPAFGAHFIAGLLPASPASSTADSSRPTLHNALVPGAIPTLDAPVVSPHSAVLTPSPTPTPGSTASASAWTSSSSNVAGAAEKTVPQTVRMEQQSLSCSTSVSASPATSTSAQVASDTIDAPDMAASVTSPSSTAPSSSPTVQFPTCSATPTVLSAPVGQCAASSASPLDDGKQNSVLYEVLSPSGSPPPAHIVVASQVTTAVKDLQKSTQSSAISSTCSPVAEAKSKSTDDGKADSIAEPTSRLSKPAAWLSPANGPLSDSTSSSEHCNSSDQKSNAVNWQERLKEIDEKMCKTEYRVNEKVIENVIKSIEPDVIEHAVGCSSALPSDSVEVKTPAPASGRRPVPLEPFSISSVAAPPAPVDGGIETFSDVPLNNSSLELIEPASRLEDTGLAKLKESLHESESHLPTITRTMSDSSRLSEPFTENRPGSSFSSLKSPVESLLSDPRRRLSADSPASCDPSNTSGSSYYTSKLDLPASTTRPLSVDVRSSKRSPRFDSSRSPASATDSASSPVLLNTKRHSSGAASSNGSPSSMHSPGEPFQRRVERPSASHEQRRHSREQRPDPSVRRLPGAGTPASGSIPPVSTASSRPAQDPLPSPTAVKSILKRPSCSSERQATLSPSAPASGARVKTANVALGDVAETKPAMDATGQTMLKRRMSEPSRDPRNEVKTQPPHQEVSALNCAVVPNVPPPISPSAVTASKSAGNTVSGARFAKQSASEQVWKTWKRQQQQKQQTVSVSSSSVADSCQSTGSLPFPPSAVITKKAVPKPVTDAKLQLAKPRQPVPSSPRPTVAKTKPINKERDSKPTSRERDSSSGLVKFEKEKTERRQKEERREKEEKHLKEKRAERREKEKRLKGKIPAADMKARKRHSSKSEHPQKERSRKERPDRLRVFDSSSDDDEFAPASALLSVGGDMYDRVKKRKCKEADDQRHEEEERSRQLYVLTQKRKQRRLESMSGLAVTSDDDSTTASNEQPAPAKPASRTASPEPVSSPALASPPAKNLLAEIFGDDDDDSPKAMSDVKHEVQRQQRHQRQSVTAESSTSNIVRTSVSSDSPFASTKRKKPPVVNDLAPVEDDILTLAASSAEKNEKRSPLSPTYSMKLFKDKSFRRNKSPPPALDNKTGAVKEKKPKVTDDVKPKIVGEAVAKCSEEYREHKHRHREEKERKPRRQTDELAYGSAELSPDVSGRTSTSQPVEVKSEVLTDLALEKPIKKEEQPVEDNVKLPDDGLTEVPDMDMVLTVNTAESTELMESTDIVEYMIAPETHDDGMDVVEDIANQVEVRAEDDMSPASRSSLNLCSGSSAADGSGESRPGRGPWSRRGRKKKGVGAPGRKPKATSGADNSPLAAHRRRSSASLKTPRALSELGVSEGDIAKILRNDMYDRIKKQRQSGQNGDDDDAEHDQQQEDDGDSDVGRDGSRRRSVERRELDNEQSDDSDSETSPAKQPCQDPVAPESQIGEAQQKVLSVISRQGKARRIRGLGRRRGSSRRLDTAHLNVKHKRKSGDSGIGGSDPPDELQVTAPETVLASPVVHTDSSSSNVTVTATSDSSVDAPVVTPVVAPVVAAEQTGSDSTGVRDMSDTSPVRVPASVPPKRGRGRKRAANVGVQPQNDEPTEHDMEEAVFVTARSIKNSGGKVVKLMSPNRAKPADSTSSAAAETSNEVTVSSPTSSNAFNFRDVSVSSPAPTATISTTTTTTTTTITTTNTNTAAAVATVASGPAQPSPLVSPSNEQGNQSSSTSTVSDSRSETAGETTNIATDSKTAVISPNKKKQWLRSYDEESCKSPVKADTRPQTAPSVPPSDPPALATDAVPIKSGPISSPPLTSPKKLATSLDTSQPLTKLETGTISSIPQGSTISTSAPTSSSPTEQSASVSLTRFSIPGGIPTNGTTLSNGHQTGSVTSPAVLQPQASSTSDAGQQEVSSASSSLIGSLPTTSTASTVSCNLVGASPATVVQMQTPGQFYQQTPVTLMAQQSVAIAPVSVSAALGGMPQLQHIKAAPVGPTTSLAQQTQNAGTASFPFPLNVPFVRPGQNVTLFQPLLNVNPAVAGLATQQAVASGTTVLQGSFLPQLVGPAATVPNSVSSNSINVMMSPTLGTMSSSAAKPTTPNRSTMQSVAGNADQPSVIYSNRVATGMTPASNVNTVVPDRHPPALQPVVQSSVAGSPQLFGLPQQQTPSLTIPANAFSSTGLASGLPLINVGSRFPSAVAAGQPQLVPSLQAATVLQPRTQHVFQQPTTAQRFVAAPNGMTPQSIAPQMPATTSSSTQEQQHNNQHPTNPAAVAKVGSGHSHLFDLLQRYPLVWQGSMALKNDQCRVQMHFISGLREITKQSLPQLSTEPQLKISQRMRLEQQQLEGVQARMQEKNNYCALIALPCGRDADEVKLQEKNLTEGFIRYFNEKQAAGILNVTSAGQSDVSFVVHIFPPCDFTTQTLTHFARDLLDTISNISYLLVIITTV